MRVAVKGEEEMNIEQVGMDCVVTLGGENRTLKNCNALKLANALYDKDGEKYSDEEMYNFGFKLGRQIKEGVN